MLIDELRLSLTSSLKTGDRRRVDTLRFLLAGVGNLAIAKYGAESQTKLTNSDVLDVIKKQVKSHLQSIAAFEKAGREELVTKEKEELTILESYLTKQP
ncbi:GatB/YqeY domain-containing protein [Candidatus Gottesmanbacteria bacterium]|nr:GatB/YqeY domain-containing protein [Candidatus Gottesmanbacteria bacterium]